MTVLTTILQLAESCLVSTSDGSIDVRADLSLGEAGEALIAIYGEARSAEQELPKNVGDSITKEAYRLGKSDLRGQSHGDSVAEDRKPLSGTS